MYFPPGSIHLETLTTKGNGRDAGYGVDGESPRLLFFSGQIYNYLSLQVQYGLLPGNEADTILQLFGKFGTKMPEKLHGVFALVLLDPKTRTVFMAVDRAGVKPLYYFLQDGQLAFASSLNDLKQAEPLQMDSENVFLHLRLGYFLQGTTPYKDVHQLEAGTYLECSANAPFMQKIRWWNVHDCYLSPSPDDLAIAQRKTEELLGESLQETIAYSKSTPTLLLSGGIDSGILTGMTAARVSKVKTLTVTFPGMFDESPLARLTAQKYQTEHIEISIRPDQLPSDVENILINYGIPFFDSSAIPSFFACREAAKGASAIFNGDGADELFGGYRRYVPFAKVDFFSLHPTVRRFSRLMHSLLPNSRSKMSLSNYIKRLTALAAKKGLPMYLSATSDIFEGFEQYLLSNPTYYLPRAEERFHKIAVSEMTPLKKIMNLDFDFVLFGDHLRKMEVASTANGLTGISPFMSNSLLAYAPTLDDQLKINGRTTKYLLRKLAEKYLPVPLIHSPKRGFEIPLKNWLDHELREMLFDYLASTNSCYQTYVSKDFVRELLENNVPISAEKRAKILWMLLTLEIWYQKS